MLRRDFLASSLLALAGGLLNKPLQGQTLTSTNYTPLRRNVGCFTARGGTIGWLVNEESIGMVDSQFPDTAQLFWEAMPGRAKQMMKVLVNTHHHPDHTLGNPVLAPHAMIHVAQENVPALQRSRHREGQPEPVCATTLFPEKWECKMGDETMRLAYHGPAHTKGDITVFFEQANVVHVGDLVFNRIHPVVDQPGGANVHHWVDVLKEITETYPEDAIYIFGHGRTDDMVTGIKADLLVFQEYLSSLIDFAEKQSKAGKSRAEIVNTKVLPGYETYPVSDRLGRALGVALDELGQEKET